MPSTSRPTRSLILGCGYLGERVARLLIERGDQVWGTTRSESRARELTALGIEPVVADVTHPETLVGLPRVDRVLYCVGFDRTAGRSIREVYVDGFRVALDALEQSQQACPLVYASSTGVYGGDDGAWVDESTPVDPQTESGRACRDAERMVPTSTRGSIILRYAGLYGPDRIMRRESLLRGEPVTGNPDKYLNFIQIDDAAAVAVAALDAARAGEHDLFLASDGNPVVRAQFYGAVAELLHAPPPRFEPPEPGSPAALREESNKRISNRKLIGRWGDLIRYPDIRAGLAASLQAEANS